jgi:hypothetical protein
MQNTKTPAVMRALYGKGNHTVEDLKAAVVAAIRREDR